MEFLYHRKFRTAILASGIEKDDTGYSSFEILRHADNRTVVHNSLELRKFVSRSKSVLTIPPVSHTGEKQGCRKEGHCKSDKCFCLHNNVCKHANIGKKYRLRIGNWDFLRNFVA